MDMPQEFEYFDITNADDSSSTPAPTVASTSWGSSDWDFSYEGYIPATVDPDWLFTIAIIIGCILINLSLPVWIHLGKRLGFHNTCDSGRHRKAAEWEAYYNKDNDRNKNSYRDDVLLKQLDDARSVISGYSYAPGGSVLEDGDRSASISGSILSGSVALSRAGTHLGFHHRPNNLRGGDAASVFSATSGFTDALLAARPKRMPHRRHGKTKRIVVSKSCMDGDNTSISVHSRDNGRKMKLDVRMAAEFKKAEMDLLQHRRYILNHGKQYMDITSNTTTSDIRNAVDDNRSEAAPSILSKLDADAISVRDAIDARDGLQMSLDFEEKIGSRQDSRGDGDISSIWNRLMEIVDFDTEMKKYLSLSGYYSAQGILEEILGIVEIAAIGRFMGIRQVSAYIVVDTVTGFTDSITTGFYECAGVLIPQANGARNNVMVGRYMQLAIIFYMITALPGAVLWGFCTDDVVMFFKFDEETARMAQLYIYSTLPGYATGGIDAVLYEFLNTIGYESYATWFTLIASCIHTGLAIGMLYLGVTDLYVLGMFETASDIICLAVNFTILVRNGWLDPYWKGLFKTNGLRDWRAIKNVVNTAIPLSFAWILTYGEFEIMTLFCRYMGDSGAEVVAWGLIGYLWSTFETITDGFGDAAEVRVGFRMGAGQVRIAKVCTEKALYVSLTTAVYATGLLFGLAVHIPSWLTPDPTIQRMIFDIIPLIGFGQILMVWGMVAWAILGAQGRIRLATVLEFFISWGIGAPVVAILVFVFNYNIEGIVGGLSIGYSIATNVYLYMLHTSDWESLSAVVVARSAVEGQTYNEFDWDDLPDNIQDAAADLGYNKWIWESDDLQPESDDKSWDELASVERKAATVLGYNKKMWNGGNKSDESSSSSSSDGSEDWESLSKEAKMAAKILGYNQSIWDNDESPPTEDKDWDELSPKERAAAKTLGYTEKRWNAEDYQDGDDESHPSSFDTVKKLEVSTPEDSSFSGKVGVLDNIIASCSFDSSNEGSEAEKSSIPSMTGITKGITNLLGLSKADEK